MTRKTLHLGLILLAAGVLNLAGCPPPTQPAELTQAILDMEQHVLDLVNDERVARDLPALVMDGRVREVARAHSEDMVARGFFGHTNPDGLNPAQRFAAAGIAYSSMGENVAMNNNFAPAETAVAGWMLSASHRDNILRTQYNRAGVGVASAGLGLYYFTLDFIGSDAKSGEEEVLYQDKPLETPQEQGQNGRDS